MGVRLAFRTILRSPWYGTTVIGTIALSISLAATVFAVVDGVLFRPLPYTHPEKLFQIAGSSGPREGTASLSAPDVGYLAEADSRITVTAYGGGTTLTHPEHPDLTIWSAGIDEHFFDVLRQYPLLGGFTVDQYRQPFAVGQTRPAIVTHAFWQQWLGGDPSAIGRTVDMVGSRLTIVGVLPSDFVFPQALRRSRPDMLVPLTLSSASSDRWNRLLNAVVRVPDTISVDEARSKLSAALAAHVDEYSPRTAIHPGPYIAVVMRPLETYLGASERPLFGIAFAAAVLLVVLGAINVAGLMAARGRDRERELTVRAALGAGRIELAKLTLIEATVIALAGSAAGLLLAQPLLTITMSLLPDSLQLLKQPAIDWRVVVFAIATACLTVGVFALVPAVTVARRASSQQLTSTNMSTPRVNSLGRNVMLVAETAIGISLVVVGALVLASFVVLRTTDPGVDPNGLAVVEVIPLGRVTPDETELQHGRVLDRLRAVSGVTAVTRVGVPILQNLLSGSQFVPPPGAHRFSAIDVPISGAFFETARLRVLDGRVLTDQEIEGGHQFAVVSEQTAREYWPGTRAIGQTLTSRERSVTVVGVVAEARLSAEDERQMGEIYLPASLGRNVWRVYLLRATRDSAVVAHEAALAIQKDVPGVLVRRAESFDAALLKSVRPYTFRTVLFATTAVAGLLLLAVGIGGLVAASVARRVREIGIRGALGARGHQLVGMIVLDHLRPSLAGALLGLAASWWTTRLVTAFLYELDAHEPGVWLAAALFVVVVTIVAAWIPAMRASRLDPMTVLRAE